MLPLKQAEPINMTGESRHATKSDPRPVNNWGPF